MSSERRRRVLSWLVSAACSAPAVTGCAIGAGSDPDHSAVLDDVASGDAAGVATDAPGVTAPPLMGAARERGEKDALLPPQPGQGAGASFSGPAPHPAGDYMLSELTVPKGFEIGILAEDVPGAGMLAAHGDHIYVTRPAYGDVLRLDDSDGDGFAERQEAVLTDLPNVQAIAFKYDQVFLAADDRVFRGRVNTLGKFGPVAPIIDQLPSCENQRYRGLGVGPDLSLYVSIAADCSSSSENAAAEDRGSLLRFALDGSSRDVFARGLRKTLGFAWHPVSGELWGMDPSFERPDTASPPDELNKIEQGGDYGSPYCYARGAVDPEAAEPPDSNKEAYCARTLPSVLEYVEQGSAMGMAFYAGKAFPPDYVGDAFVALHGSFSARSAAGYKVVRVHFRDGVPVGFEDFVSGFLIDGQFSFGRPTGVAVAQDGALIFSDDQNGFVYRVAYRG